MSVLILCDVLEQQLYSVIISVLHFFNGKTFSRKPAQKNQITPPIKEKGRGSNTKKEPEPLIELLYQEFPKTDPVEIERITKRVKQWLEQKHQYYEKLSNKIAKKLGENATEAYVSKAYPHCIEALLQELILST